MNETYAKQRDETLKIIGRRRRDSLRKLLISTISSKYIPGIKERIFPDGKTDLIFDDCMDNYRAERRACILAGIDVSKYDNKVAKLTKDLFKINIFPRFTYL